MDETALRDVESWKDRIEVRLDNRQVFFLFFGSAIVACMLFVVGVIVGKRLESRGRALAPMVEDPLAALDRFGAERGGVVAAPSALTFPRALLGGGSPAVPAGHVAKNDKKVEERKADEKRAEEKKVEERTERAERTPSKNPAPPRAAVAVAVAEPATAPAAVPAPVVPRIGADDPSASNRKLAALPRPLGAPDTAVARAATSGSHEMGAPKASAPTSKVSAAATIPKEGPTPSPAASRPVAVATTPGARSVTLTSAKPASAPLAKAGIPAPSAKSAAITPPSPRTVAAAAPAKIPTVATTAAPSSKGAAAAPAHRGFLLQLSSFQDRSEADAFARRFASESAYVVPTDVPGKGTVYRVRVGSYASLKEAAAAKTSFEQTHNVIAYVAGSGPAQ